MTSPDDGSTDTLETIPPDEQKYIGLIADLLRTQVSQTYPPGKTLRDAHPKQHGTVAAQFIVSDDLAPELRVGLFKEPGTYNALIRFSNANPAVGPDIRADVRGMAIKLLGVKGKKLLDDGPDADTHDFITISYDVFLTKDVAEMYTFTLAFFKGKLNMFWYMFNPLNPHLRIFWNYITSAKKATSPLDLKYYSMTPYLFGTKAVKYSARPWSHIPSAIPPHPTENYLRDALQRHLAKEPIHFDFMVQFRTVPSSMPIEDAGKRWSQKLSPFIKVATIVIPPQELETAQKMEFGDNLSFTPWRCLPEHRPLGGINRCRKTAYQAISVFRHERNAARRAEPTQRDFDLFCENKATIERTKGQPAQVPPRQDDWSRETWWVRFYSYVTLLAALYGVGYAHIPVIVGAHWSVCTSDNMLACVLTIHLFEVPMVLVNIVLAWFGLRKFSRATVMQYQSLLGVAITFNMVFFAFETNLLIQGIAQSYPFWELFAFGSIAVVLLLGTVFTVVIKQMLVRSVEFVISRSRG
jgi:hypothetical protein